MFTLDQVVPSAIRELCRVADEVRIFPLLALGSSPSPFVNQTVEQLRTSGHDVSIEGVPYEFQRGANQMMRIRRQPLHTHRAID